MHGIHNIKLDSSGAVLSPVKNTTKFNFMTQQLKVQKLHKVLCHGVFNTTVMSVLLEKSHDRLSTILVTGPARDSQSAALIAELLPLTVAVMTIVQNLLHHFHLCYSFGKGNNASRNGRATVYYWQIVFHYTLSEVATQRPALAIRHAAFSHTF